MNAPEPCGTFLVGCPDCGDKGPHDVYKSDLGREFVCCACGMQHTVLASGEVRPLKKPAAPRCCHEIAPYVGTGEDPPTCGALATHMRGRRHLCVAHYWIEKTRRETVSSRERDAQVRALQFVRNRTPQGIDQVIEDVRSGKVNL